MKTIAAFGMIAPAGKNGEEIVAPFAFATKDAVIEFIADLYGVEPGKMATLMLNKGVRIVPVTITEVQ